MTAKTEQRTVSVFTCNLCDYEAIVPIPELGAVPPAPPPGWVTMLHGPRHVCPECAGRIKGPTPR